MEPGDIAFAVYGALVEVLGMDEEQAATVACWVGGLVMAEA